MDYSKEQIVEIANQMYSTGEFEDLKSGKSSLGRIEEMAQLVVFSESGSFTFWAIGQVQVIYMADQIKVLRRVLEKLGYKVKVAVDGKDKANKRVHSRGRTTYHGASKRRVISFSPARIEGAQG